MPIKAPDIARKRKTTPPKKLKPLNRPVTLYVLDDERFEAEARKYGFSPRKNGFVHVVKYLGIKLSERVYVRARAVTGVLFHEIGHLTGQIEHE